MFQRSIILVMMSLFLAGAEPRPIPREVTKNHSHGSNKRDSDAQAENKDAPSPIESYQEKSTEVTQRDKQKTESITVSPIDVNSVKLGPLDVNKDWADYAFVLFSFVLVIIGGLQAWIYSRQAGYMRETLDITKRGLTLLERAYLDIQSGRFRPVPDQECVFAYEIKNTGRSRAYIKKIRTHTYIGPDWPSLEEFPTEIPSLPTEYTLPSGQSVTRNVQIRSMSAAEIEELNRREIRIAVVGFIVYSDIFNNPHFTRFCRVYDPKAYRFGDESGGFIPERQARPGYNDAD